MVFKSDGRLLAAQALGQDGSAVDKRISALAIAIQMGATVYDLEEAELCYAPQFGSAKDPVNFAGMVAAIDSASQREVGFCCFKYDLITKGEEYAKR